ncbi:hypothetical protein FOZ63_009713 [Perkinsus olseni]|uniref:t-SNARE coiled-coil homology domain-containing protein n=1 Tax=Perkinsus olseni TaxID=32597 RepID=A0A7J6RZV5_PEROL|nr:hypothetical protein FOZ63_009713 [Perkinsus olseni]
MDLLGGGQQQEQLTSTQREMMATVKSTMAKAHDTDETSARTAEIVQSQGEQIDRINENSHQIESNLDTSSWLLKGLSSWGGRMRNAWGGQPKKDIPKPARTGLEHSARSSSKDGGHRDTSGSPKLCTDGTAQKGAGAASSSNTAQQQQQQQEKSQFDAELDKHLDGLSNVLGGIHARY